MLLLAYFALIISTKLEAIEEEDLTRQTENDELEAKLLAENYKLKNELLVSQSALREAQAELAAMRNELSRKNSGIERLKSKHELDLKEALDNKSLELVEVDLSKAQEDVASLEEEKLSLEHQLKLAMEKEESLRRRCEDVNKNHERYCLRSFISRCACCFYCFCFQCD